MATASRTREANFRDRRVFHRRSRITTTGTAGSATGSEYFPTGPCKLTHVKVDFHADNAATANTLIVADPTDFSAGTGGRTLLTLTDTETDVAIRALGQPSATDEARNATAATDAVDGGGLIRDGVHTSIVETDAVTEAVVVDYWFHRLQLVEFDLVAQSGADGTGAVTRTIRLGRAGRLVGLHLDFQNMPATTDVVIKADSTDGETLFTSTSSLTDIGPVSLGIVGIDEAGGALAATDGSTGGAPFRSGLFFDVAEADVFTSSNEKIAVKLWIEV
jgi:hypothetical protein